MRVIIAVLATVLAPVSALAALPPIYQNERDLSIMVEFVRSHDLVLEGLRSIDLELGLVRYSGNCVARFGRPRSVSAMPGPVPGLSYLGSNCPIQHAKSTLSN